MSRPRFSAVSIASSLAPVLPAFGDEGGDCGDRASSAFASGWSGETAAKVAPKIVSGRVV